MIFPELQNKYPKLSNILELSILFSSWLTHCSQKDYSLSEAESVVFCVTGHNYTFLLQVAGILHLKQTSRNGICGKEFDFVSRYSKLLHGDNHPASATKRQCRNILPALYSLT